MNFLLKRSNNFREYLKKALTIDDVDERLNRLFNLAQFQLGYVDMIQVDKAILSFSKYAETEFKHVRLAILSSCTIDHLLPAIRVSGLRRRLLIDIYTVAYGQYRQELLDPTSSLYTFDPDVVIFSLTAHESIANIPLAASNEQVESALLHSVSELCGHWRKAHKNFNATVIQQSFLNVSEPLFGSYDRFVPAAPTRLISRLNEQLAEAASSEGVLWFDLTQACIRDGIDFWFDLTHWLQGKIEIAPQAAASYGDLLVRMIAALKGLSKKCLVLDLDNTLWGGVIGDDGMDGIVMGEGSAVGEAYLGLQRYVKMLKERGIILAVCSKNDLATAQMVFTDHPEILLELSDIAIFVANWNDKVENLRLIARQLNIGLDSLVFIDDNPVERARVRECLSMVAVPELPDDPAYYARCIANSGYFEACGFTVEDRQRTDQYIANHDRKTLQSISQNMDEFLLGLEMSVVFGFTTSLDLGRVTQLFNKTNQFNTTTRRYTKEEIKRFSTDPEMLVLQFRLEDRFGDNGLVSAIILSGKQSELSILEIENWVMSCRVFGRQLEDEVMNIVTEIAKQRGIHTLHASFVPTKKNSVIRELFEKLGFSKVPSQTDDGITRWVINLPDYVNRSTFITHKTKT